MAQGLDRDVVGQQPQQTDSHIIGPLLPYCPWVHMLVDVEEMAVMAWQRSKLEGMRRVLAERLASNAVAAD